MTNEEINFFDHLSQTWDANEVLSTPDKILDILSLVGVERNMKILDLGTGTGVLIPFLSEIAGPSGEVMAVDASEGMLEKAVKKFGDLKNVSFVNLDFEKQKIDGYYDLIFLYCVYPHLHAPKETLHYLAANNLSPHGKIIIAFPSDENFINNIHKEKKAESDLLPSAPELKKRLNEWGLEAEVIAYNKEKYIVAVSV